MKVVVLQRQVFHSGRGLLCALAGIALVPLGVIEAQGYELSGRELANGRRYVQTFRATPDGQRVLYSLGRTSVAARAALFSVSSAGGETPVELSRGTPSFVSEFQLSADGIRVVYRADETSFELFELFSARCDGGGTRVVLSQDGCSGDVHSFALTPDGSLVLYLRDLSQGDARLFSVPSDGSAPPELLSQGADHVADFVLSPDGSRVVYRTGSQNAGALLSVPTDRSFAPVELNDPLPIRDVLGYRVSPDGTRVVYTALQGSARRLFSVPIDRALPPVALDGPGGRVAGNFELTPDGQAAVYLADEDVPETFELYHVLLDGSQGPQRISGALVAGGDVERAAALTLDAAGRGFRIAPGGGRVVYVADADRDELLELYSAPLDGSRAALRLNDGFVGGGNVRFAPQGPPFELTNDGQRVVYVADRDADEVFELYSAPLDASTPPVELNSSLDGFLHRDVVGFHLTQDGSRVLYRANQETALSFDLFAVPSDGSHHPRRLSAPTPLGGFQVSSYGSDPRSQLALYLADDDHDGIVELYANPLRKVRRR